MVVTVTWKTPAALKLAPAPRAGNSRLIVSFAGWGVMSHVSKMSCAKGLFTEEAPVAVMAEPLAEMVGHSAWLKTAPGACGKGLSVVYCMSNVTCLVFVAKKALLTF